MSYCIKDPETVETLRELAALRGETMAACLRRVCAKELAREQAPLAEKIRPLAAQLVGRRWTKEGGARK
jgi:hypothetical protein